MPTTRLEAFSDGVIAIIITIMVLELKVPHGADLDALRPLLPVFLSYVLSFVYLGIYWNNHHHMLHAVTQSTGGVLWANLHLLFWLSLLPFVTGWMGENHFAAMPTARCTASSCCWPRSPTPSCSADDHRAAKGRTRRSRKAVGSDFKGKMSLAALHRRASPLRVRAPWIARRALRRGRADLAGAGQAHRARAAG